ncbi:MAG: Uncharacterized MFS-type transporter, partial [uncultured Thermoleophilia bacterium]
ADDHPRHHDRERGAALHPGRSGLRAVQPGLGGQRLPDRLRRPAPARRPARRPRRAPPHVPRRPHRLHGRVPALRRGPDPGDAHRRPLPAGHRRCDDVRGDPRDDRDDVPRAGRAGEGHRRLQLRRGGRGLDRPAGRRRADRGHQLALDLLRQPPDRRGHRRAGASPARSGHGHRPAPRRRPPRRGARHERAHARRLHHRPRRGGGLGVGEHAGPRRALVRPPGRLRRPRGDRGEPARAAAHLPLADRLRRQRRPGPDGRRDVRDVLPRRAVPAAGPGLRRHRGGPRVPARRAEHRDPVRGHRAAAHRPLRREGDAAARARAHGGGAGLLPAPAARRELRRGPVPGDAPARPGRRPVLPVAHDAGHVGRHTGGLRPGVRPGQHDPAGRRGPRAGCARDPVDHPDREPPRPRRAGRVRPDGRLRAGVHHRRRAAARRAGARGRGPAVPAGRRPGRRGRGARARDRV